MARFRDIHVSTPALGDDNQLGRLRRFGRGFDKAAADSVTENLRGIGPEAAARRFLQLYLEDANDGDLAALSSPDRPEVAPDMRLEGSEAVLELESIAVAFQQTAKSIPVFGGRVVVDVGNEGSTLVAINGRLAPVPDQRAQVRLSPDSARTLLLKQVQSGKLAYERDALPELVWYLDEDIEEWHLCYHFKSFPAAPRDGRGIDAKKSGPPVGCIRARPPIMLFDYLVDANSGTVVYYFQSIAGLDIPSEMTGNDENGTLQTFHGLYSGRDYLLADPLRDIETYDYGLQDIDAPVTPPLPQDPIRFNTASVGNSARAAVSAHCNATRVFDFFNDTLKRKGIDNKGMKLVSVVNVYSSYGNGPPPDWGNAMWANSKMWYGQENGVSFARFLDVIAHELTHGVTETSSQLAYRDLPGALNESFSDIFGIFVANWFPGQPNALSTWSWEIGPGLGARGGPLRNFRDPAAAGQPDHMRQYQKLPPSQDNGGVHLYSGIHNKAVYNLLTGTNGTATALPVREVALLLYYTLTRLTRLSDFSESRRTLKAIAETYYQGNGTQRKVWVHAIAKAFDAVGIP